MAGFSRPSARAFTLIELLVVVAIIAILAAIAVPNFLAAQVRAKVSRAKADMKTIVSALEMYRVDHNYYPTYHYSDTRTFLLEFHIGGEVPSARTPDPNWDGRNPITTPVAYISKMPDDPFSNKLFAKPEETKEYLYVNWPYAIQQFQNDPLLPSFMLAYKHYGSYRLHSRGPDTKGPDSGLPYDATNGTVSPGDITYGPNTGFDRFIDFPD